MTGEPISVVIAAHDEAGVLGHSLRRLLDGARPGELEVIVVANGCTDRTAEIAREVPGVHVIELAEPSKPAALNAGDTAAGGFPRVYLDADIALSAADVRALAAMLTEPGAAPHTEPGTAPLAVAPLAVAPRRRLATAGRPPLVRAYYAINGRLPAYRGTLFGRGAIALSAAGRSRFDRFPDQVADDLFLDSLFLDSEKREVGDVVAVVETPLRTRDLLRRLARVRAGNSALRRAGHQAPGGGLVRPARRASWLVDVVLPAPWLLPAGLCYAMLALLAAISARRSATRAGWGRDESSRTGWGQDESGTTAPKGAHR